MPLFRTRRPFILIFIRDVRKCYGKNKTQGNGLKIDFNDGKTCYNRIREKPRPRPLKTGVSPPAGACLAAVAWHYCYNGTLYAGRAAACGLPPSQVEYAQRVKIAILPIRRLHARTLKYG